MDVARWTRNSTRRWCEAAGNPEVARCHREVTERIRIIRRLDFTQIASGSTRPTRSTRRSCVRSSGAGRTNRPALLSAHIEASKAEVRKIRLHMLYTARRESAAGCTTRIAAGRGVRRKSSSTGWRVPAGVARRRRCGSRPWSRRRPCGRGPRALDAELAGDRYGGALAMPLFGVPFAVKDNIDVAGCRPPRPARPSRYTPAAHATVVQRLLDAGAILIGKTNLDQFATGLVGTRSPYGACRNAFDARLHLRRLELRARRSRWRRPGELRARHRHRRIGPRAGGVQQHRRAQADARAASARPAWCRPAARSTACRCSR